MKKLITPMANTATWLCGYGIVEKGRNNCFIAAYALRKLNAKPYHIGNPS
ncbi:MAG: hypothetical protein SFU87_09505 [Chitinophagaceae bacterium]|nr:hypothetical protein [Chitinophagaceae bacterium]